MNTFCDKGTKTSHTLELSSHWHTMSEREQLWNDDVATINEIIIYLIREVNAPVMLNPCNNSTWTGSEQEVKAKARPAKSSIITINHNITLRLQCCIMKTQPKNCCKTYCLSPENWRPTWFCDASISSLASESQNWTFLCFCSADSLIHFKALSFAWPSLAATGTWDKEEQVVNNRYDWVLGTVEIFKQKRSRNQKLGQNSYQDFCMRR